MPPRLPRPPRCFCSSNASWWKKFPIRWVFERKISLHNEWKTSSIFPLFSPSNAIFHSRRNKQQQKILFNNSFLLLFSWMGGMLMHMCPLFAILFRHPYSYNDEWQYARWMHLGKWDGNSIFSSSFFILLLDDCWSG